MSVIENREMATIRAYVKRSHDDGALEILKNIFQDEAKDMTDAQSQINLVETMATEMYDNNRIAEEFIGDFKRDFTAEINTPTAQ